MHTLLALCREVQYRLVTAVFPCSAVECPRGLFLVIEVSKVVLFASMGDVSWPLAPTLGPVDSSVLRRIAATAAAADVMLLCFFDINKNPLPSVALLLV
jgi:hypothetical protein